jgi:hypothetical protein
MTKRELLAKYRPYPTYTQIALEAFEVGLNIGKEEKKNSNNFDSNLSNEHL